MLTVKIQSLLRPDNFPRIGTDLRNIDKILITDRRIFSGSFQHLDAEELVPGKRPEQIVLQESENRLPGGKNPERPCFPCLVPLPGPE